MAVVSVSMAAVGSCVPPDCAVMGGPLTGAGGDGGYDVKPMAATEVCGRGGRVEVAAVVVEVPGAMEPNEASDTRLLGLELRRRLYEWGVDEHGEGSRRRRDRDAILKAGVEADECRSRHRTTGEQQ